jgi:hypothetical protein
MIKTVTRALYLLTFACIGSGIFFILASQFPMLPHCATDVTGAERRESKQIPLLDRRDHLAFPDMTRHIAIVGRNTRPDAPLPSYRLKSDCNEVLAIEGERFYCHFRPEGLAFADTPTSIWCSIEKGIATVGYIDSCGAEARQRCSLPRQPPPDYDATPLFASLQLYGPDRLYARYGGERYGPLAACCRLVQEGHPPLYVALGEVVSYADGAWHKGVGAGPIATLTAAGGGKWEFDVWDETGCCRGHIALAEEPPSAWQSAETPLSHLVQSTEGSAACRIGEREELVVEGDFFARIRGDYCRISTAADLQASIEALPSSELLVIDSFINRGEALTCKAYLYDSLRTTEQELVLPVERRRGITRSQQEQET